MPGGKRKTKSALYKEQNNDDDDFVSTVEPTKKTRNGKLNDPPSELNCSTRRSSRKREEKLSKIEQEELDLVLELSKETVKMTETSIQFPISAVNKENISTINSRTSTVSSDESKTIITDNEIDEREDNSLPKSKRMKVEEEEENIDENEIDHEEDEVEDEETDEDEKEKKKEQNKIICKIEVTNKNSTLPTVNSIDLNSSRSLTRNQQKSSISTTNVPKKQSNAPIGFPTSKINITSVQASRVGLSRKASTIKSLHPNLNQRVVHE